jgi:hypothetical protein
MTHARGNCPHQTHDFQKHWCIPEDFQGASQVAVMLCFIQRTTCTILSGASNGFNNRSLQSGACGPPLTSIFGTSSICSTGL